MDILKYITIDEALDLIQKNIKANDSYNLSAKRLLENYIEAGKIKALFKFNGFLTTYKYHDFGEVKGSIELKQISKVKGYFHEISTVYPSDFTTYVFCSNLDKLDYEIFQAVPYELLSNEFIATHYKFWKLENDDDLNKFYGKETYRETFNIELGEPVTLFNSMPIIDKELSTFTHNELVQLSKRDIYFETTDIQSLIDSLPKSKKQIDIEQQLIYAQSKIGGLESELKKAKLADKSHNDNKPTDDEPTHHKSVGSMQALVTTLIKMAEYDKADLADPYGELNKLIQAKAEVLGLSVKKDFIAKWLKKADDVL